MSGNKSRRGARLISRSFCNLDLSVVASFADLVVLAGEFHPIPFRTRPLKPPAPMVLRLKPRESRSLPGQQRTRKRNPAFTICRMTRVKQHNAESLDTFARLLECRAIHPTQPKEREFPSLRRFNDGGKFNHISDSTRCWMKIGGNVTAAGAVFSHGTAPILGRIASTAGFPRRG